MHHPSRHNWVSMWMMACQSMRGVELRLNRAPGLVVRAAVPGSPTSALNHLDCVPVVSYLLQCIKKKVPGSVLLHCCNFLTSWRSAACDDCLGWFSLLLLYICIYCYYLYQPWTKPLIPHIPPPTLHTHTPQSPGLPAIEFWHRKMEIQLS